MSAAEQLMCQAQRYVGMPCKPGRFDCVHLAALVQEEVFGRKLADWLRQRHPVSPTAQRLILERTREALADLAALPETGDAVLFKHAVQVRRTDLVDVWHVGTLFIDGVGQHWVLHTHAGAGSTVLEPLQACRTRGLRLDGFYRWRAAA